MTPRTIAITGATGFVGSTLVRLALVAGWQVRALTRSPRPEQDGLVWINGALDQPERLLDLCTGCDAVIHVAGVVNAPSRAGFEAGNIAGTQSVIAAVKASGVNRFVHVSSLAAREPSLSNYGWSKAQAESLVAASGLDWTMVRPPAIYGPGDKDMLDLFKMAKTGWMLMPPPGRMSVIEVSDLARLLLALIDEGSTHGQIFEADDGRADGWSHDGFGQAIGKAMEMRVTTLATPKILLALASRVDRLVRRGGAKLTQDRVNYFCHPNWVIDATKRPPQTIWQPIVNTPSGLKETARFYREAGWL